MLSENMKIHRDEFKKRMEDSGKAKLLLDVRSDDEHKSGTIPGALCIPHDQLEEQIMKLPRDVELLLFCRSGGRSAKACETLKKYGFSKISELEGGFTAWSEAGLPIAKKRRAISIQRQVMIVAGILVLTGAVLGHLVNYNFFALAAFVGLGLTLAGITGFCGMALLLERMPWNK